MKLRKRLAALALAALTLLTCLTGCGSAGDDGDRLSLSVRVGDKPAPMSKHRLPVSSHTGRCGGGVTE